MLAKNLIFKTEDDVLVDKLYEKNMKRNNFFGIHKAIEERSRIRSCVRIR